MKIENFKVVCGNHTQRKNLSQSHKGKLNDDEWLSSIYRIRSRWVPAYVEDIFSAGICQVANE